MSTTFDMKELGSQVSHASPTMPTTNPTLELSFQVTGDQFHLLVAAVSQVMLASLEDRPEYMTTEEVAAYLGWTKKRIDNFCAQGRIPFRSNGPGCTRTFVRRDIDQWYQMLHGVSVEEALLAA